MRKSYQHLSLAERTLIQTQLEIGLTPAAIARSLNRPASTVSRELRRNGWKRLPTARAAGGPPMAGVYLAETAEKRARTCARTPRVERRLQPGTILWDLVLFYMQTGHSPEQASGILARVYSDTPSMQVSHETIYTAIYAMPRGELALRSSAGCDSVIPSAVREHAARTDVARFRIW